MNNEEHALVTHQDAGTPQCGPGCNCGKTGPAAKTKMIVCLIVAVAAAAVLARTYIRKSENIPAQGQGTFSATFPVLGNASSPTAEKAQETNAKQSTIVSWGEPLKSLASLNEVAKDDGAVFVYLPEKGQKTNQATQKEIEAAAKKVRAGGTTVALFRLGEDSPDYKNAGATIPCVMALVKGRGASIVSGEITEAKLLQAMVEASRPSACGAGGCGSGGCQ